jgi:23S rRNA pseudouridine1911/1915/1917 synthase
MGEIEQERILYESADCLVVNKLPGEAVEGAAAGMGDLPALLAERYAAQGGFLPTAVHLLDVPVSGCALFARNQEALAGLNGAMTEGRIEKWYWAIIEAPAAPIPESGELVHWIISDTQKNKAKAYTQPGVNRKKAVLRYHVIGTGDRYLCLEIELVTGRHHQIRAQLAASALHIKGDLKYGARRSEKGGGIRLHARSLTFPDRGNRIVRVTAPLPFTDPLWELAGNKE